MVIEFFIIFQIAVTAFLCGLIWFIQVVHYPLFREIPESEFLYYHSKHMKKTAFLTIFSMIVEAFTVGVLVFLFQRGTKPYLITMMGLIALGLIWLSTFGLQLPRHLKIKTDHKIENINFLIRSNWIRTILWTIRLITSIITALIVF
jgi:hypothetical protein